MLLGVGDAVIFVSVLRLVVFWFPARQNPLVLQITGQLGQVGAIASAVPLIAALDGLGWTPTFALAAALSGVVGIGPLRHAASAATNASAVSPSSRPWPSRCCGATRSWSRA